MKKLQIAGIIVLMHAIILPCQGQLVINEIQSSNFTTVFDPGGNLSQWVELYNDEGSSIYLDGYYISDDLSDPYKCRINEGKASAKDYYVLWLERRGDGISEFFSMDMDGGFFALFSPEGELIDSVTYPRQFHDVSYGRITKESDEWVYFAESTPNSSNSTTAIIEGVLPEEVKFSLKAGFYSGTQSLELTTESTSGEIRYTKDGTWPTESSTRYSNSIQISENTVVRARVYEEDMLPGRTITQTYLIDEEVSFPVVSISTDPDYFYGSSDGIHVAGSNGITGNCMDEPVNWNNDWERPVNFEYFSVDGAQQINQMTGTKIYGGCSRMFLFKSLAIYARNQYGDNRLNYKFFESKDVDEFKSIVLRNSGNDAYYSLFRDAFMQSLLVGRMDVDYQAYQPAVIFINGEYHGMLNVREKISEHYPASNFDIDADDINMLVKDWYEPEETPVSGTGEQYADLMDYLDGHDLDDQDAYDYVCTQIDVNEYMNYCIAEIYFQNEDWLVNNTKNWRPKKEGGKWRWVLYDTDFGWGLIPKSGNCLEYATTPGPNTKLLTSLLENEGFKNEWIQRMIAHVYSTFDPARVTTIYDSLLGAVRLEVDRHRDLWGRPSEWRYDRTVDEDMPEFTRRRPDIMRDQINQEFRIGGWYELSTDVNDPSMGYIMASGVELPPDFSGSFFDHIPLRLTAIPKSGYTFSHWEEESSSSSSEIFLEINYNTGIRAVFEPAAAISGIYINEVSASARTGLIDDYTQSEDWIEIYNDNDFEVDLAGWYLSDSAGYPTKYQIPIGTPEQTRVNAKSYLVFWSDNDDRQGPLHTNFKLKREGEFISLVQPLVGDLHVVDTVTFDEIHPYLTYGRQPEDRTWDFLTPTPDARNDSEELKDLHINEYLASNNGLVEDEYGEAEDWIEIYNPSDEAVDVGGMFLTDSLMDPLKHRIPSGDNSTIIPAKGHLVLWADNQPEQGVLHLGFKLKSSKEQIGLYQVGSGYADSLSYTTDYGELASGRYPDGNEQHQYVTATPGKANEIRTLENLFINEFMASNRTTLSDSHGEYADWIEIYNGNTYAVDIGGLFITDSLANRTRQRIRSDVPDSTTIPAGGFLILWADNQTEEGVLHLGFKLSASGEEIGLIQPNGIDFVDSLHYSRMYPDMALGLYQDGSTNLQVVSSSPGSSNYILPTEILHISEIVASGNNSNADEYGEFNDWIEIHNSNEFPVNIGGLFITDSLGDKQKHYIPTRYPDSTTIAPGEKLVLWADGDEDQGILHIDFKLKGSGEQVALIGRDGTMIVDTVSYPNQHSNFSYSRLDDVGEWRFLRPTYADSNVVADLSGVVINEVMNDNESTLEDGFGEFDDWIELYNTTNHAIDVGGLYLSDSLDDPFSFRISSEYPDSTTLSPGEHLLFWADNDEEQGVLHLGFGISKSGEHLGLFGYTGELIDSIYVPAISANSSWGRLTDANPSWVQFVNPTPLMSNIMTSNTITEAVNKGIWVYPNPMRNNGIFEIPVVDQGRVRIEIYNSKGSLCSLLQKEHQESGNLIFEWDVRDASGSHLPGGLYLYRVVSGDVLYAGKILVDQE